MSSLEIGDQCLMPVRPLVIACVVAALALVQPACGGDGDGSGAAIDDGGRGAVSGQMQLTSETFSDGAPIPVMYTCSGEDVSPPLRWEQAPDGVASFALIMDDPDAPGGTFDHWLVYDMPPSTRELPSGVNPAGSAKLGTNSRGKTAYMGPCPPPGPPHTYRFRLFALDSTPKLDEGASKSELLDAMEGHVLDSALLTGTFGR